MKSDRQPKYKSRTEKYLATPMNKSVFTFTVFGLREGVLPDVLETKKPGCEELNNRMQLEQQRIVQQMRRNLELFRLREQEWRRLEDVAIKAQSVRKK